MKACHVCHAYSTSSNPTTEKPKLKNKKCKDITNKKNEKENLVAVVYHINSLKNKFITNML